MARYINTDLAPMWLNTDACEQIKHIPTADVVEVVRCKDCVFYKTPNCMMHHKCLMYNEQYSWASDNSFCSCGKRECEESEDE